jgi:non-ribosomal peptide synthase protein (TIGR01720 family)
VGWFTTQGPVLLEASGDDVLTSLRRVKARLHEAAGKLLAYGRLRYLGSEETRRRLAEAPRAEVSFNYLGQWDNLGQTGGLLRSGDRAVGTGRSSEELRPYLLDVTAVVMGGRLQIVWSYSRNLHRRETIVARAERYVELLRRFL